MYINTPCFQFGDCIDKGQTDNTFWISQLDVYLRQSAEHLTSTLKTIERNIYQSDKGNLTIFDGTPEPMCMPTEELSQNNAFLRKMHSAYRLSELARKCKIMTMDIMAQVLTRLQSISETLDSNNNQQIDLENIENNQQIDLENIENNQQIDLENIENPETTIETAIHLFRLGYS